MNGNDALAQHAPALERNMKRALGDNCTAFEQLRQLFNFVMTHGGLEDSTITQRVDDSFNPKAARVVQIMISTHDEQSAEVFAAAMLATIPRDYWQQAPFFQQSSRLIGSPPVNQALALDTIRHLHQSNLTLEEKVAELSKAKDLADQSTEDSPYKRLLSHAIMQQERRCIR